MKTKVTVEQKVKNQLLSQWAICGIIANDRKTWIYSLVGKVIKETDATPPSTHFINTSPIVAYANGVVTTITGSTYKLGKADPIYGSHDSQLIGDILNPWISGNNWLTI